MGFLDKAKAAANDLASKADSALSSAGLGSPGAPTFGEADWFFRDLGLLVYLQETGREGAPSERERILAALRALESRGEVHTLSLHTAPPPAPGMAAATPAAWAPPPVPGTAAAPPVTAPPAAAPEAPRPAAPPPPSWASGGNG